MWFKRLSTGLALKAELFPVQPLKCDATYSFLSSMYTQTLLHRFYSPPHCETSASQYQGAPHWSPNLIISASRCYCKIDADDDIDEL